MNIIAIGGGSLRNKETLPIDRHIVKLTGKKHPRALFIPTASEDDEEYCTAAFDRIYGEVLGCITEHLLLYRRPEDRKHAAEKIRSADLIYVGGGNTLRMMRFWRRLGIDKMLIKAARGGTVMAGLSAGAICWHAWGHSDSRSYSGKKDWNYIKVRALGLIPVLYCPHLDGEKRHVSFKAMVEKEGMFGIGCDNNAAVWYHNGKATSIASNGKARVYTYLPSKKGVVVEGFRSGASFDLIR